MNRISPIRAWFDAIPDALLLVDDRGTIVYANSRCEGILEWPPDELVGRQVEVLLPPQVTGHVALREQYVAAPHNRHMGTGLALSARTRSGVCVPVDIALSPIVHDGVRYTMAAVRDARAPQEAIEQLLVQSIALDAAASGVLITNANEFIIWVNPAVCRMTGYAPDELVGQRPSVLKSGEHPPEFFADLWATIRSGRTWTGSIVNRRKDGSCYFEEQTIAPVRNRTGEIGHFIAIKQDVTARVLAERALCETRDELERRVAEVESLHEQLRQQAIHDPLTGSFNRRYLDETLPRELARARRERTPLTVVAIDVDEFKVANDRFGHPVGDRLLTELADVLRAGTRESDIACRFGGDEFLVVLTGATAAEARRLAESWRLAFANVAVRSGGEEVRATLSAGVAEARPGESPEVLYARADAALYAAKQRGRNLTVMADEAHLESVTLATDS